MEYVYVGIDVDVDFDVAVSSTGGVHNNVDVMGVSLLYHCHHLCFFFRLLSLFSRLYHKDTNTSPNFASIALVPRYVLTYLSLNLVGSPVSCLFMLAIPSTAPSPFLSLNNSTLTSTVPS